MLCPDRNVDELDVDELDELDPETLLLFRFVSFPDGNVDEAKAQEARANVIEAEVQIPQAMAEAFRAGHLGIMDYYKFDNIKADTDMRSSIAKPGGKGSGKTSK